MSSFRVETDDKQGVDCLIDETSGSRAMVNRLGCELIGYRITDPQSGKEIPLMYRDSVVEPPEHGWKNRATVLFPIVGGLKDKRSMLGDRVISTRGNHGFARHSTFELVRTDTVECALAGYRLLPNQEIRGYYPLDFSLELEFSLKGSGLSVAFTVTNPGQEPIYYCLGWHPGFAAPVFPGLGEKSGCRLVLPRGTARKYHNNEHCRLTGETSPVETGGPLPWTEEELEATLMFGIEDPKMRRVDFQDPASGVSVRVDFPDFPHLGFWSEPGYGFICIEPWQGMDDHEEQEPFDRKVGVVRLEPGGRDRRTIRLTPSVG
ncbi:MAG: hypothetical protein JXQ83_07865 [Candidatus Glassbacteria bacterium]|nr:hypothetical protein [Candidatus Glassbacteria bacterium]